MPSKRAASGTTTAAAIPPSVNARSVQPSTAASSSIHTDSPLKSYSSTSASNPTPSSTSSATQKPTAATAKRTSSSTQGNGAIAEAQDIVTNIWNKYVTETPQRVKLIDTFMAFLVALGGIQFAYVVLAGNYPFNAFLSGFSATVGQFVLTASLRIQTNPANKNEFSKAFSDERAFADFVFGSLVLHFFCVNFIN